MITKCLILSLASALLMGCATTRPAMDQSGYNSMSDYRGALKKCFDAGLISPKLYSDAEVAVDYPLSKYSFDSDKLYSMTNVAYSMAVASPALCLETEAAAYFMIKTAETGRANAVRSSAPIVIQNNSVPNYYPQPPTVNVNVCAKPGPFGTCR